MPAAVTFDDVLAAAARIAPHARTTPVLRSGALDALAALAPDTICDGLRAGLGAPGFDILRAHGAGVLLVDDAGTLAAMRLVWQRMKQLVEPSSAIALAAVLAHRGRFAGLRVGVVLSGGNVDPDHLPRMAA